MNEDELRYAEAIQKSQRSLVDYRHIMLINGDTEVEPAEFHFEWSHILLNGSGNDAIEGFRESGKTQYVLRAFPLYCLQFPSDRRDYIVIIKKNARLASAKLKEIGNEYESNPGISSNCIKIVEQSAESFAVDVRGQDGRKHNIRIEAYGKGASIRGLANVDRRPKVVIIDDPQDVEDASSPTMQQSDWDWFLSDVMFLGQRTRIFAIGNNLGETCILERIGANASDLGFTFQRQPCMDANGSTWPSKFKVDEIERERNAFERLGKLPIWLREKMCLAVSDETRIFRKSDFQYFNLNSFIKTRIYACNVFLVADPASSMADDSDYRCIIACAVDADNYWYILEVAYGRWDSVGFFDHLFRMSVAWGTREVGIEEGIYLQAIEKFLDREQRRRNQFFTVTPLKHGRVKKEERIKVLQPRFRTQSILFAEGQTWLGEMEAELLAFTMQGTKGLHDDLIDTLAYLEQIVRVPYKGNAKNANLPRVTDDSKYAYI